MKRRSRRARNPFNQPKPAEWATMSKSLRKAWNRKHWRPHDYMVVVPLKRYATRKANQRDGGSGRGMLQLAAKIEKLKASNPGRDVERRYNEAVATAERQISSVTAQFRKADVLERKRLRSERKRIEREETVRPLRSNPRGRRRNPSTEQHLIEAIGDWLQAEDEQGAVRFYENIENKPRNRLLIKSVWTMAHRLGITTREQLDRFKAKHHRELAALL
jgi:hypothetical protein